MPKVVDKPVPSHSNGHFIKLKGCKVLLNSEEDGIIIKTPCRKLDSDEVETLCRLFPNTSALIEKAMNFEALFACVDD